ncbi:hypothetical protein VNI00_004240 [Paramarasmius palmivorus]|uniref:F-box protein n=1 Tax=Paramarasmius palmivorus TaxID=297713 RepID=A0AAW0DMC3_9AGAR
MQQQAAGPPQELIDAVLENLDPLEDRRSLQQCALAARCLLPSAQRLLFHTLVLYEPTPMTRLHHVFETSPHLAKYVVKLGLILQPSHWPGADSDWSGTPLPPIISRLATLEEVNIQTVWEYPAVPVSARQLCTLLGGERTPKIRRLALHGIPFTDVHQISSICKHFAAYGDLQDFYFSGTRTIDTTSASNMDSGPTASPSSPIVLRKMSVAHDAAIMAAFFAWAVSSDSCLRFHELRQLSVGELTEESLASFARILDMCKGSLRYLHVQGSIPESLFAPFGNLRDLRTISCFVPATQSPLLNAWCTTLKDHKELKLESFVVIIDSPMWRALNVGSILLDQFANYPWNLLEDALMDIAQCIRLEVQISQSRSERVTTNSLKDCFPRAHAEMRFELVVKQELSAGRSAESTSWEYRSRSGVWKKTGSKRGPSIF